MKNSYIKIPAVLLSMSILFILFANFPSNFRGKSDSPIVANAVTYIGNCGDDCKWTLNLKLSTLTIDGTGKTSDFQYKGSTPWYKYRDNIEKIVINNGVEVIGEHMFSGLGKVKKVSLASTVKQISSNAFYACSSLKNIEVPSLSELSIIGDSAFAYCRKLEGLPSFPQLTTVEEKAFYYCYLLDNIELGYSVTQIGKSAFSYCPSLKNIKIVNFDCNIYDDENTFDKNICIEAFNNSTAKTYCDKYGRSFKTLKSIKFINDREIKLEYNSISYDGKKKKPTVTVEGLRKGKDFVLKYSNNIEPGVAEVTVSAAGNTLGNLTLNFKINPEKVTGLKLKERKKTSVSFSWEKVHGADKYEIFMLNNGNWEKIDSTKNTSYTCKNLSSAQKYSFKVRAVCVDKDKKCNGKFSSVFSEYTKPSEPEISDIRMLRGGGKLRIGFSRVQGADGYEIFMAIGKKGKYKKITDINSSKKLSVVVNNLSNSNKYYFKIRCYIRNGKTVIYSQFSPIKTSNVL